jgi:predicted DNA binding CopG/RHH family protein
LFSERKDRVDDSPAAANLLFQSVRFMALTNAEFVHLPAREWSKAQRAAFPNLKPSTASISIRLSSAALMRIKQEANKRDVPYQSLIKLWLNEKLEACGRP